MIANYVNEQHDTWDQFLREFAYAIRTAVNETTGKTLAELFVGRKLITPFQKLVMVSDGTEFAVGDIERLFEEAKRNTKTKHEKWEKYYNRRRRDVQIKKEKPKGRDGNVHHKRLISETMKGEKRGVPTQQEGPVRSRKGRERNDSPYIEKRTRSSNKDARRGGDQQRQDHERRGTWTKKSLSLEVLVGNANYKS
ncbi:uncharacterized protein TNCV_55861 [Trichonephila clavipes]|nr:uncharacterized protein TNCV_55861 [Trichonephila clavipes]